MWLDSWTYRKKVTITGQAGAGTNYQVRLKVGESSGSAGVNFHTEGNSSDFPSDKNDSGDLRFTSSDGTTLLDFWVEQVTGTTPNRIAYIWLEVADSLETNQDVYCYYGKSGADNVSNGENTFLFYDGFDDESLNTDKWEWVRESVGNWDEGVTSPDELNIKTTDTEFWNGTWTAPILKRKTAITVDHEALVHLKFSPTTNYHNAGMINYSSDTNWVYFLRQYGGGQHIGFAKNTATTIQTINYTGTNFWIGLRKVSTTYNGLYGTDSFTLSVSNAGTNTITNEYLGLLVFDTSSGAPQINAIFDDFIVKKYVATEPTYSSAGAEESHFITKTITSVAHIKGNITQNITSSAYIDNTKQTIISNANIVEVCHNKFIHNSHIYIVTDTNPIKVIKVYLYDPSIYTIYTLTGKLNAKDLVINHDREYLYLSSNNGYIIKVSLIDPSSYTSFYLGENKQLYSISHSEDYLITFASDLEADESLFVLDESEKSIINMDLRVRRSEQELINTYLSAGFGALINTDLRAKKLSQSIIETDLRVNKIIYKDVSLSPLGIEDFHIKINGTELADNDLKLNSIKITHTADNKSTATFTLTRKHDDLNNPTRITDNNIVKIYFTNRESNPEFIGKIIALQASSESESVEVSCESDEINSNYGLRTIDLPLTAPNEQLHLYDVLINDVSIDNPYIDNQIIIISEAGMFWNGFKWTSKRANALIFGSFQGAYGYIEANKSNDNFTKATPRVDNKEESPKYYKGIKINKGTKITERVIMGFNYMDEKKLAEQMEEGTFKFKPGYSYFWYVTIQVYGLIGETSWGGYIFSPSDEPHLYIGTNLAPLSGDLYEVLWANYIEQEIFDDLEVELGYYLVGEAPYKEVSCKNGKRISCQRYIDKVDGLYWGTDGETYDYLQYVEDVAAIEYKKLKNINGNILPITSVNLDLHIDAYLYYKLKLLNRVNIINTTHKNIYKNSNGFPVSIKQISIDSGTMKVNLTCDNIKSNYEIELLDGEYPIEPLVIAGEFQKVSGKFDLANEEYVDEKEEEE